MDKDEQSSPDIEQNTALAERIERGLSIEMDAGAFFAPPLSRSQWKSIAAALRSPNAAATPSKPVAWRWCERPHDVWRVTEIKPFPKAGRLIEPLYAAPQPVNAAQPSPVSLEQMAVTTELFFGLTSFMEDSK